MAKKKRFPTRTCKDCGERTHAARLVCPKCGTHKKALVLGEDIMIKDDQSSADDDDMTIGDFTNHICLGLRFLHECFDSVEYAKEVLLAADKIYNERNKNE